MTLTTTTKRRQFTEDERRQYREEKRAAADGILAEVLAMFESGELPEMVAQTVIARAAGAPIGRWSVLNQLLAIRAGTTDARGFKQWLEVGRHVRKGSRAFRILGPVLRKVENEDGELEQRCMGFTPIPVFRVQDTDGDELEQNLRPPELPPLFDVAERLGVTVGYMPAHEAAGFRGYYMPGTREIALVTHDVRTFFHELAHAGHDYVLGGKIDEADPAAAEIIAETVAATLCRLYGFDGFLYHGAAYVERFAGGENAGRAAAKVIADVQKVLYLLLDPVEGGAA